MRRLALGGGFGIVAIVSVFVLLGRADRVMFEWRAARFERLSEASVDGFVSLPQTVEAFEVELDRFRALTSRRTLRDIDGPGGVALTRHTWFHALYMAILLEDARRLDGLTMPPSPEMCSQFADRFAQVFDPALHADRYQQICGPLGG